MQYDEIRPLIAAATTRLLTTVEALGDPHRTASLLPGWSQAHVLTHLARNADGMRNLFLAARSGSFVAMYASPEIRAADIMTGATRPANLLALDVRVAAERLTVDLDAMPDRAWDAAVAMSADPDAMLVPAPVLALFRLAEVELHHVDLDAGARFDDIAAPGLAALLRVCHLRLRDRTPPFTPHGSRFGSLVAIRPFRDQRRAAPGDGRCRRGHRLVDRPRRRSARDHWRRRPPVSPQLLSSTGPGSAVTTADPGTAGAPPRTRES